MIKHVNNYGGLREWNESGNSLYCAEENLIFGGVKP